MQKLASQYLDELFSLDIAESREHLRALNSTAGSAAQRIVRKTDELEIKDVVFAEAADRYSHTAFKVHIFKYLRTVVLLTVLNELLRSVRKLVFLRQAFEVDDPVDELLMKVIESGPKKLMVSEKGAAYDCSR